MEALTKTISDYSGKTQSVNVLIDKQKKAVIQQNREKLKSIVETVVFLGRNGLPFRGYRDDSRFHPEIGTHGGKSSG